MVSIRSASGRSALWPRETYVLPLVMPGAYPQMDRPAIPRAHIHAKVLF